VTIPENDDEIEVWVRGPDPAHLGLLREVVAKQGRQVHKKREERTDER
jgi:hypothetical protein